MTLANGKNYAESLTVRMGNQLPTKCVAQTVLSKRENEVEVQAETAS